MKNERIAALESRLAATEARIAILESPHEIPKKWCDECSIYGIYYGCLRAQQDHPAADDHAD
jgi:hypothetical protein